ncbi:PIN domain-containing protein [Blastococcus montanus]|uniref:PIN domain-containing protein n=1 Tax=Blastococcus montanus TaxID=3144973 RepID=UPI00320B97B3
MSSSHTAPVAYADGLMGELDATERAYLAVLETSAIERYDPVPGVIGLPPWAWAASEAPLEAARMRLLAQVRDFRPRFQLLFRYPTPEVAQRHTDAFELLEGWLVRAGGDLSAPGSIDSAVVQLRAAVQVLRDSRRLLPADVLAVRVVADTNALIDCPDLTAYAGQLGKRYRVHLLPVVLGELDDLKRSGRTPEMREAARSAVRRLKALRQSGDVRSGVRVAGDISAVFEHVEPRGEKLPGWLDLNVPDDRLVASALLLQSAHPGSAVFVATGDLNLQTKLTAVRLPFVELPD